MSQDETKDSDRREMDLTVPRELAALDLAITSIKKFLETIDHPIASGSQLLSVIELAVAEGFSNAVKYGAPLKQSGTDQIDLHLTITPDTIEIQLCDYGSGFDLQKIPTPSFAHHKENGYGLYLIQKMMDHVSYTIEANRNVLRMEKNTGKNHHREEG